MEMKNALMTREAGLGLEIFEQAGSIANRISKSGLLPQAVRGKPDDLMIIMVTGYELGLNPMQSLRSIYVVQGRPVMAAELLTALVKKHPSCEYFRLVESTDERAIYETKRKGEPEPTRIAWTIQQAQKAKLIGRDNWQAHPAAMLRARASASLARAVYPDVAMGIYDTDEALDMIAGADGVYVEASTKAPPSPEKANGAAVEEDIEDAILSDEPQGEDGAPHEDDLPETWLQRIEGAADIQGLQLVGKLLMDRFPSKDHPIRLEMREPYAERQKALRMEAQQ